MAINYLVDVPECPDENCITAEALCAHLLEIGIAAKEGCELAILNAPVFTPEGKEGQFIEQVLVIPFSADEDCFFIIKDCTGREISDTFLYISKNPVMEYAELCDAAIALEAGIPEFFIDPSDCELIERKISKESIDTVFKNKCIISLNRDSEALDKYILLNAPGAAHQLQLSNDDISDLIESAASLLHSMQKGDVPALKS